MILLHTELATLYDIEVELEECVKKRGEGGPLEICLLSTVGMLH